MDKKFLKLLWDIYKKVPAIHLAGNVILFPNEFLLRKIPALEKFVDKKQYDAVVTARQQYLTTCNQSLTKEAQTYYMQVSSWLIEMESAATKTNSLMDSLNKRAMMFIQVSIFFP